MRRESRVCEDSQGAEGISCLPILPVPAASLPDWCSCVASFLRALTPVKDTKGYSIFNSWNCLMNLPRLGRFGVGGGTKQQATFQLFLFNPPLPPPRYLSIGGHRGGLVKVKRYFSEHKPQYQFKIILTTSKSTQKMISKKDILEKL